MKKRNWKKVVLIVVSVLAGLILCAGIGLSLFVGKLSAEGLLYMNEGNDTKQNSIDQLAEWGYDLESFQECFKGEELTLESKDGVKVPATYYKMAAENTAEENQVVILVHGAGGDRVSVVPLAELYLENGWSVLTFDQRGSGDNSDDKVSFGYYEALDVECLVDYAVNVIGADKVVVHGQSMGGATAGLYAVTEHAKENLDAAILDSPVDSMERMFRGVFEGMEGSEDIPTDYVVACGDIYLKLFYGFSFEDTEIINRMTENQVKTLVILSEKDELCLPESMEELYNNIDTDKKALMRVDSEHIEGAIDDPEEYICQVLEFIEE